MNSVYYVEFIWIYRGFAWIWIDLDVAFKGISHCCVWLPEGLPNHQVWLTTTTSCLLRGSQRCVLTIPARSGSASSCGAMSRSRCEALEIEIVLRWQCRGEHTHIPMDFWCFFIFLQTQSGIEVRFGIWWTHIGHFTVEHGHWLLSYYLPSGIIMNYPCLCTRCSSKTAK